ncbi:hypothetical protein L596_009888 [Steinernema carpocapsae]|uniref:Uncharacterized protein n=1 Tax=Steinernema carpocapsae TaxID=34508 RepID=A0A4U5PGN5_STECR|nr:hypothetical protein L596_009888 [Steinernema carpocapsae]
MNSLPFLFVDSVAHSLSTNSITEFSFLPSHLWNSVGQTHCHKRADYDTDLHIEDTEAMKVKNYRYTRILTFIMCIRSARDPKITAKDLPFSNIFVHTLKIVNLYSSDKNLAVKNSKVIWQKAVPHLIISMNCPTEIIIHHLFHNENLRIFEFSYATYDFIYNLVTSYGQGKLQKWNYFGRDLEEVCELGFEETEESIYQLYETRYINGTERTLSFRFSTEHV